MKEDKEIITTIYIIRLYTADYLFLQFTLPTKFLEELGYSPKFYSKFSISWVLSDEITKRYTWRLLVQRISDLILLKSEEPGMIEYDLVGYIGRTGGSVKQSTPVGLNEFLAPDLERIIEVLGEGGDSGVGKVLVNYIEWLRYERSNPGIGNSSI